MWPLTGGAPSAPEVDELLVERVAGGDRDAFGELYKRHVKRVFNLLYRITGSADEAEEVTQETFYLAYRGLPAFQRRSQFYTWLYRIASNLGLQHLKRRLRRSRERSFDEASGHFHVTDQSLLPAPTAEKRELYTDLHRAIDKLPVNQRVVMILGPIQGHSYMQMAQILSSTEEIIKSRLHRARMNVRRMIAPVERPHAQA